MCGLWDTVWSSLTYIVCRLTVCNGLYDCSPVGIDGGKLFEEVTDVEFLG
jgi:hypothetical protein